MSFDMKSLSALSDAVRGKCPLVHCITNYVTVNDCANALLAVGASPVMADDIGEVEDVVSIADALVINIGTLNERTVLSMKAAGKKAASRGIPIVLDPVGAGASRLRTETAFALIKEINFTVIRGNFSEIETLCNGSGHTRGVDAVIDGRLSRDVAPAVSVARELSLSTGAIVVITGAVDIIASRDGYFTVSNGHPLMPRITGSGCMLSAILGGFCAASPSSAFEAAAAACSTMGLAGEMAAATSADRGTGSFRVSLIDALSLIDTRVLSGGMRIESFTF